MGYGFEKKIISTSRQHFRKTKMNDKVLEEPLK